MPRLVRKRRITLGLMVLALLLWLGAESLDTVGPVRGDSDAGVRGPAAEPAVRLAADAAAEHPLPAPELETVTAADSRERSAERAAHADRLWGVVSRLEAGCGEGAPRERVLAAWDALREGAQLLRSLPPEVALLERYRKAEGSLLRRLEDSLREAEGSIEAGRGLAAERALVRHGAIGRGRALATAPLETVELLRPRSVDRRKVADLPVSVPAAFPAGLAVRAEFEGRLVSGTVLRCSSDRVTLRLRTGSGTLYPSLPPMAVEPEDVGAEGALALARSSLEHGRATLAACWLRIAAARGGDAEQIEALAACLQR